MQPLHESAQLLSQAGDKPFIINDLQEILDHELSRKSRRDASILSDDCPLAPAIGRARITTDGDLRQPRANRKLCHVTFLLTIHLALK